MPAGSFSLQSFTCPCFWARSSSPNYDNGNCFGGGADSAAQTRNGMEDHIASDSARDRGPALLVAPASGQRAFEPHSARVWDGPEIRAHESGLAALRFRNAVR